MAIDRGGVGWASVLAANAQQVREGLIAQGLTPASIDRFLEVLADPDTVVGSVC